MKERTVAKNLRLVMSLKSLNYKELAAKSGLDRKYISNIVKGAQCPTTDKVEQLARAMHLDGWELLFPGLEDYAGSIDTLHNVMSKYSRASKETQEYVSLTLDRDSAKLNG